MTLIRKHTDYKALLFFLAVLIFYCYTYFESQLFMYPGRVHAWAQADRLALALSFYDNGMNFFKPATFNQFSIDGVVGVEFPIQSYIAAALGKISDRTYISFFFRLENVFISCAGLMFLFEACYKRTRSFVFSIATPLFIFASPVFIYYTCNYLPDTAGTSMAFIAFYFILNFFDSGKFRDFLKAVIFLTLGTLIKTSIVVYFIGFVSFVGFQQLVNFRLINRKDMIRMLTLTCIACLLIAANYYYIQYLNDTYKSWLFLGEPKPFKGFAAFQQYINENFKPILVHAYLSQPQYLLWAVVVFAMFPFLLKDKQESVRLRLSLLFFTGAIGMFWLMGENMPVHDYYFISIFLPFFGFIFLASILQLHKQMRAGSGLIAGNIALVTGILICFFFADYAAYQRLHGRPNSSDLSFSTDWMQNGARVMDSLLIPKDETILVFNEHEPNLSLIYFDRKGYVISPEWQVGMYPDELERIMQEKEVNILVTKAQHVHHFETGNPAFFDHFNHLVTTGEIVVYKFDKQ